MQIYINIENQISLSNFQKQIEIKETATFDKEVKETLLKNNIKYFKKSFNMDPTNTSTDSVGKIIKYDYIFFDKNENILAIWKYKNKILYF